MIKRSRQTVNIHQILPNLSFGDAIGNLVFDLQDMFIKWGYKSEIYVQTTDKRLKNRVFDIHQYDTESCEKTICIYHFSIGSGLADFLKNLKCKKIVINHNITPPEYMRGLNDHAEHMIKVGLSELEQIVKFADLVLCDSEYNRQQVADMSCKNARIFPVVINFDRLKNGYSHVIREILNDGHVNILHVGRIVPNKKIEDIIKVFYYYKNMINNKSSLYLVGQFTKMGVEGYHQRLLEFCDELGLSDVFFHGKIDQDELNAYYKFCDVYISMSEHEGFCVPLIESMYFDLPVMAYDSTAIPYTLDDSGILLKKKNYSEIAGLIDLIIKDDSFRSKIIKKQRERIDRYMSYDFEKTIEGYIESLDDDKN